MVLFGNNYWPEKLLQLKKNQSLLPQAIWCCLKELSPGIWFLRKFQTFYFFSLPFTVSFLLHGVIFISKTINNCFLTFVHSTLNVLNTKLCVFIFLET